jgi:oligosaccharide repeat unit polymerase
LFRLILPQRYKYWRNKTMHIEALLDLINWSAFIALYIFIFGISCLLFYKSTYGIYDPAWLVPATLSMSVTVAAYLFFYEKVVSESHLIYLSLSLLAFLFGVGVTNYAQKKSVRHDAYVVTSNYGNYVQFNQLRKLLRFLQMAMIVLIISRAAFQGLPIFAENPEEMKVDVNTEGFGIITRFLGSFVSLSISTSFLLAAKKVYGNRQLVQSLVAPLIVLFSSGSKGSLIVLLVSYTACQAYLYGTDSSHRAQRPVKFLVLSVIAIVGYALLILIMRGTNESQSDPFGYALSTFGLRLLAYSDGVFYYFLNDLDKIIQFNPLEYFWDYLIAPLLALLRVINYPISLGLRISGEMFGAEKFGPNPTMFVEGFAYFGSVGGILYCALIGILFSLLRGNAFNRRYKFSTFKFARYVLFFSSAQLVAFDMLLFVGECINTALTLALLWIVLKLMSSRSTEGRLTVAS